MQGFESIDHIEDESPYLLLFKLSFVLLVLRNLLKEVTVIAELHNDAQYGVCVFEEHLLVTDDVGMPYRRKNAYFVERVLLFLLREVRELHLLQCVDLPILDTLHSINHAVGALT